MAIARDEFLSEGKARMLQLIAHTGHSPHRWKHLMSVFLENKPGIRLFDKLRGVLLLEGDCNMYNKVIFGVRMLDNAYSAA